MKKYFIYSYLLIVCLESLFFYFHYKDNKFHQQLILDSNMFYDYRISKELLDSKLRNIYLKHWDRYIIKKTLYNIGNGNKNAVTLLTTLYYTDFHEYKNLLKNIIFYDKNGKFITSAIQKDEKNIQLENYHKFIDKKEFFLEYTDKKEKNIVKLYSLEFQGSVVGYIKQVVAFDVFMRDFLSKYRFTLFNNPNKKDQVDNNLVILKPINQANLYFVLEDLQVGKEFLKLKSNLFLNIFFSGFFTLCILYIIYLSLKKEQFLRDEIKLQKEFFKKIINTSPNPVFVKDESGKYLLANEATAKLFKVDNPQMMVDKTNEELHLNINNKVLESLKKQEQNSLKLKQTQFKEVQKIGDQFYKFVHVPIFDFEYPTNKNMVIGYATDITSEIEKKNKLSQLNTQLKIDINDEVSNRFKINEKFKKIFNNIQNAMFVCKVDKSGILSDFIDINASGKIFLKRFTHFENKTPQEIFNGFQFQYNQKLNQFEMKKYSYILKIPHGDDNINFQVSCNIVFLNNDFHAVIFVQLIDNILKLKKEKKEKQVLLENIFKKAKSGIAVIDKDGEIKRFNKSFYETIGVSKTYFDSNNFFSLFRSNKQEDIKKEHYELFKTNKEFSKEYTFKVDNRVNVVASSTLIADSNDEKLRLFIFEDITKQKQLELEQYQNSRIIAQQAKMAEMGEMIGAIAHQWRQPLNAINAAAIRLNFASTLDLLDIHEVQEKTKFIEKQSLKMSETINDFMYFFTPSKEKQIFYLESIYKKIFDFLEPQLKNREITMSLERSDEITIFGFQNEFEHILLNLINNAKDAFENVSNLDNKYIKVIAYEEDLFNIIEVIDNAGGIPQDILNKIFNPYFTTKEEGKGTGIGLYMTKTIIDKHFQGSIEVSNNDHGAVFKLIIPKEQND